jgi:hypothetical protein
MIAIDERLFAALVVIVLAFRRDAVARQQGGSPLSRRARGSHREVDTTRNTL